MDKGIAAIPAYYACYLLRSTVRHQSLYVGSTPHPVRRVRQHNGDAKGGAARTSKDSLRPWEMTCLVSGFPSKIAALQFEWAWQNTHLTRHVSPNSRLTHAKSSIRISPKSGRIRKRTTRPRMGLTDRLANLHLLLRASSFERWPLKVTFYAEDVFRVWTKWTNQHLDKLRPGIDVTLDDSNRAASEDNVPSAPATGIKGIDVGYSSLKPRIEKTRRLLENSDWLHCALCKKGLPSGGEMTLICPNESCETMAHLECLASAFITSGKSADAVVPISGHCPGCRTELQWVDLVKELSLRMRGEKEIEAIFKKKRARKNAAATDVEDEDAEDEDEIDEPIPEAGDWHELPDSSDMEANDEPATRSDPSPAFKVASFKSRKRAVPYTDPVIEDSDWDEAAVLT